MMHEFFQMFMTQLWQVTLLVVVVWIVTKTLCKRRPHLGHALWLLVLVKCVVPPVFSSSAGVYSWLQAEDRPAVVNSSALVTKSVSLSPPKVPIVKSVQTPPVVAKLAPRIADTPKPTAIVAKPAQPRRTNFATPPPKQDAATPVAAKPVAATPFANTRPPIRSTSKRALSPTAFWYSWIVTVWLGGAALLLAVTVLRYLRFRTWLRRQTVVESGNIQSQVSGLAKQLKLRRKIRVNVVDADFGPAVIGLLRPTIVLPNSIVADQTAEQLKPILGHELLHLRRGDIYWSVLQVVACSLMWFHPLV